MVSHENAQALLNDDNLKVEGRGGQSQSLSFLGQQQKWKLRDAGHHGQLGPALSHAQSNFLSLPTGGPESSAVSPGTSEAGR